MLVLKKQGPPPSEGEQVDLDISQVQRLQDLHSKWSALGDEAAIRHNSTQATLGCLSWIITLVILAAVIWALFFR